MTSRTLRRMVFGSSVSRIAIKIRFDADHEKEVNSFIGGQCKLHIENIQQYPLLGYSNKSPTQLLLSDNNKVFPILSSVTINEPPHGKTYNPHRRKQRHRSASLRSLSTPLCSLLG